MHDQLVSISNKIGITAPALEKIGYTHANDDQAILDEFWETFDILQAQTSTNLNHSRSPELLAINMPELRVIAKANKVKLPDIGTLRRILKTSHQPQFVDIKAVNSATKAQAVKCWVFHSPNTALLGVMH